jgi:hypothetical protein
MLLVIPPEAAVNEPPPLVNAVSKRRSMFGLRRGL